MDCFFAGGLRPRKKITLRLVHRFIFLKDLVFRKIYDILFSRSFYEYILAGKDKEICF